MQIRLTRPPNDLGRLRKLKVYVDGHLAAKVRPGGRIFIETTAPSANVYVRMDFSRSNTVTIEPHDPNIPLLEAGFVPTAKRWTPFELQIEQVSEPARSVGSSNLGQREIVTPRFNIPDALSQAIFRFPQPDQALMLRGWDGIGEEGRAAYADYLGKARSRRASKARAGLAAEQLLDPSASLRFPPRFGDAI
jgi:hypothetical protein